MNAQKKDLWFNAFKRSLCFWGQSQYNVNMAFYYQNGIILIKIPPFAWSVSPHIVDIKASIQCLTDELTENINQKLLWSIMI